jgi:hypothetical protein
MNSSIHSPQIKPVVGLLLPTVSNTVLGFVEQGDAYPEQLDILIGEVLPHVRAFAANPP